MLRRLLLVALGWLGALGLLTTGLALFSNPILPLPSALWERLVELLSGPLWPDLMLTALRSIVAFLLALISGIFWAAVFPPRLRRGVLAGPSLLILQAAPVILWIVPLVLLLGTGNAAPVAASVFVVMPLIAFEFRTAFEMTSRERREFWRHYVPFYPRRLALRLYHEWRPHLASATGMGLLMSFKASVIAEWFAARNGIGRQLQYAFAVVDTASFLGYALAFLLTSLSLTALAQAGMRRIGFVRRVFAATRLREEERELPAPLHLEGISLRFGRQQILDGVDLELRPGEIAVLTGRSGCGKSTLARIAAGVIKPDAGSISLPTGHVFLVFQSDFLFPTENVRENVAFNVAEKNLKSAEEAIRRVGLESDVLAGDLSGGMRRRLALARGLASNTPFLVLDEPFTGLDQRAVEQLLLLLGVEAKAGRGILIITHNLVEPLRNMASAIYELSGAKLQHIAP